MLYMHACDMSKMRASDMSHLHACHVQHRYEGLIARDPTVAVAYSYLATAIVAKYQVEIGYRCTQMGLGFAFTAYTNCIQPCSFLI